MKGHFLGRRNLYYKRTFHYERFHKEKKARKKIILLGNQILFYREAYLMKGWFY